MRFLPIDFLQGDETLAVNIFNSDMQILVRQGATLSEKIIKRLKNNGIQSVYVVDMKMKEYIKRDISETIEPSVRHNSVLKIRNAFERFEAQVKHQKKSLRYGDYGELLFKEVKNISSNLITEVMKHKDQMITMNDIKRISDYHYQHAVNVAVLSLIIAAELGLKSYDIEALTYGALLMDIGNQWIDKEVLNQPGPLSLEEKIKIHDHVIKGYRYITDNTTFDAHVKSIIMHHHERINGTGYPAGLKGDDIHPLAKIIMIADVYDALTSDRPHRRAYNQHEAIEYIMGNAGSLFDFELANIFVRKVVPYPVGTYVLLSNEQKGIVVDNNPDHPLRPIIRTFGVSAYTHRNSFQVNLLEEPNITIKSIIYTLH